MSLEEQINKLHFIWLGQTYVKWVKHYAYILNKGMMRIRIQREKEEKTQRRGKRNERLLYN